MKNNNINDEIIYLYDKGYFQRQIAEKLGISQSRVSGIINNKKNRKKPSKRKQKIFDDFIKGKSFAEVEKKYEISYFEVKDILLDERFYR